MLVSKTLKIFVVALAVASVPTAVWAVPQLPHLFYGTITINSNPAPVGTIVIAKVNGIEKGRITTAEAGKYGGPGAYDQKLLVQGDITGGAQITFSVSGVAAIQTASFESGKVEEKNLEFTIAQVEVSNANLSDLLDNGTLAVSGTNNESATALNVTQQAVINVAVDGGTNKVILPQNTIITKTGGGTFNANSLTANSVIPSSLLGLGTGVVVKGALQWGLANLGLEFSSPISISIFVGTALNGQTLNVQRSTTGNSGWTNDGIVSPATCVVASGYCSFSATKASYYAATQTTTTTTTTTTSGGGGGGGGGIIIPTPKAGDTNNDSRVDILDFNTLMINWGKTGTGNITDFNSDGKVDIFDFNILMVNWS